MQEFQFPGTMEDSSLVQSALVLAGFKTTLDTTSTWAWTSVQGTKEDVGLFRKMYFSIMEFEGR
jgi:hypothetical protein